MQNNQNHQLSKCQTHAFSLKALHRERRPNLNASLLMCRGKQTKNKKTKTQCLNFEGPILNRDKCHATPAFILPSQKIEYLQSAREILRQHQKRVKQSEDGIDELYVPKPRSKNMHCNVCRQNYEEYLDHIQSSAHRMNISNSNFNGHILELTKKFNKNQNNEHNIQSTESSYREQIEDSVFIVGATGKKKVKTQSEQNNNVNFFPFLNQNLNYAPMTTSYPSFSFTYYPNNSFIEAMNPSVYINNNYINQMNFNPFSNMVPQLSYPLFCMPFQQPYTLNLFQQA